MYPYLSGFHITIYNLLLFYCLYFILSFLHALKKNSEYKQYTQNTYSVPGIVNMDKMASLFLRML